MSAPPAASASGTADDQRRGRARVQLGEAAWHSTPRRSIASQFGAQRGDQRAGQHRQGSASTGAAVSTSKETMVPLSAFSHLRPGHHAAGGQSPGAVRRHHDLVQPGTRQVAERRDGGDRPGDAPRSTCRPAIHGSFRAPPDLPAVARQRAAADPGGADRRSTSCSACSTRASPPDHDPVDPAVGRRRRGAGADALQHGVQPHRADRRHPADRHRQEERHHDDRLRARGRAHARG